MFTTASIPTIVVRRIIRHKGSTSALLVGGHRSFNSLADVVAFARKTKKVYAYIDSDGNEGTIRSGRLMRRVDAHVRNTVASFEVGGIQRPLVEVKEDSSSLRERLEREAQEAWDEFVKQAVAQ